MHGAHWFKDMPQQQMTGHKKQHVGMKSQSASCVQGRAYKAGVLTERSTLAAVVNWIQSEGHL